MDDSDVKEGQLSHDEMWDDTLLIQQYDSTMEQLKKRAEQQMQNSGQNSPASQANGSRVAASTSAFALPGGKKKLKKKKNTKTEWLVGSACRCEYSEDGVLYEATITDLDQTAGHAVITYVGYGNSETVPLHKLLRSKGSAARQQQEAGAEEDGGYGHESGVGEEENSDSSSRLTTSPSLASRQGGSAAGSSTRATTSSRSSSCFGAFMPDGGGVLPDLPPPPPLAMSLSGQDDSEMLHTLLMSWYMTGYHTGYYRGVRAARHKHRHH